MIPKSLFVVSLFCLYYARGLPSSLNVGPQVLLEQGALEGLASVTKNGFKYNSYLGIPYATPPVGELRFQDPLPPINWKGTFKATTLGSSCPQLQMMGFKGYEGDEDCLFLNVYVPVTATNNSKLPVMFWVHGGGFKQGDGGPSLFGPDYIVEENVILVTINYRLGALGFMTVYNEDNSGNMGIKDQLLALRWVNTYIEFFGGDPENINIFGESAGGMSVETIILSPRSEGLFKRAIAQSGPTVFDVTFKEDADQYAYALGSFLGINTTDPNELLNYLKTIPAEDITVAATMVSNILHVRDMFSPIAERASKNPVLTKQPYDIFMSGDFNPVKEILYGICNQEGLLNLPKGNRNRTIDWDNVTIEELIFDFEMFIPREIRDTIDPSLRPKAAKLIKDFYFPNNDSVLTDAIDLFSDFWFIKNVQFSFIKMLPKIQIGYFYTFSYHGELNYFKDMIPFEYTGASHADELGYLFSGTYGEPTEVDDKLTIKRMVEMWTNYAKYGNPTPFASEAVNVIWEPATENNFNYLGIDSELTPGEDPFNERMEFWKTLEDQINSSV